MTAVNLSGTALDKDVPTAHMSFPATYPTLLGGGFQATVRSDGQVQMSELSAGHYVKLSGGPYTHDKMMALWQGLAALGLSPR